VTAALFLLEDVHLPTNFLWGVIEPGLASTWPRSMSSFSTPRRSTPTLSPAWPWSSSLRNISTPVTTLLRVGPKPMISTSSLTLMIPRSMRPVATVPRPLIENTSSTARRKGLSISRTGSGMKLSSARPSSWIFSSHWASPLRAGSAAPRITGVSSPGNWYLLRELAHLHLDQVQDLGVVDGVALVEEHHDAGHADLAGEEHVLAGLRHHRVEGGHHQDRAVHLRGAGDHVLDVVGVAGAVDVRVVAVVGLVLHVRRGDGHRLGGVALDAALGDVLVRDRLELAPFAFDSTALIAAVSVVLPWSM
jgi:hypothetical protein